MSPRGSAEQNLSIVTYQGTEDRALTCDICSGNAAELYVCGLCHQAGDRECVRPTQLLEAPGRCVSERRLAWAIGQQSRAQTAVQKHRGQATLSASVASLRQLALDVSGLMGPAGLSLGAT